MRSDSAVPIGDVAPAVVRAAAASAVILGCGVVSGLIAARMLGPAGRGELAVISVWASTITYAGTLGVPEATAYLSAAEPAARNRVWTTGQACAVVLGVLVMLGGWVMLPLLFSGDRAGTANSIRSYLTFFAVPCMSSLCACAWLQGAGRTQAFNLCRSAVHIVNAGGMAVLLVARDRSVMHFAAALLIGNATTWLLAVGMGPVTRVAAAPPSASMAGRLLHYGMRVQVGNWSNAANVQLDQLLLSLFVAASSLGLYVVAVTYASVLLTLPASAALVMLPDIVRHHGNGTARVALERWYRRVLWPAAIAALVIAGSSIVLVPALFGAAFQPSIPLTVLLAPAILMLGMNQILAAAFRGIGRPEVGSKSQLIGVVVTVVSLTALLPAYGIWGAAMASLLAYGTAHFYLTRQALSIFGVDLKKLYVPTRGDFSEVSVMAGQLRRQLFGGRPQPSVSARGVK